MSTYTKSNAFTGLGLIFEIGTNASVPVYTVVGEIRTFAGPDLKGETADVTNVESPGGVKEFLATLVDPGELDFTVNYVPDDPGQAACLTALTAVPKPKLPFMLTLPPSSEETGETGPGVWNFTGLVTGYKVDIPLDKEATLAIKIKISGLPTYTAAP